VNCSGRIRTIATNFLVHHQTRLSTGPIELCPHERDESGRAFGQLYPMICCFAFANATRAASTPASNLRMAERYFLRSR